MSLPNYPGGTIVNTYIAVDTRTLIVDNFKTQLVNAGWTATGNKAYADLTITGLPNDGETVTLDGTVYTWKNTPVGTFDVQIGGSAAACATNLAADINANDTKFDGQVISSTIVRCMWKVAGTAGTNKPVSEASANMTFDVGNLRKGGYRITSAIDTQGKQMALTLEDPNTADVNVYFESMEGDALSSALPLSPSGGRTLHVILHKFGGAIFLDASYTTAGCELLFGLGMCDSDAVGKVISSVANNGGAFKVTTSTAHGRTTGDAVFIANALGVAGLNGTHTITVNSSTEYTLDGSTYAAGYTANSAIAAGPGEISRMFFAMYNPGGLHLSLRSTLHPGVSGVPQFVCVNQYFYYDASSTRKIAVMKSGTPGDTSGNMVRTRFGGREFIRLPRLGWPVTAVNGTFEWTMIMYGAILVTADAPMDATKASFDGHSWWSFTDDDSTETKGGIWLQTN